MRVSHGAWTDRKRWHTTVVQRALRAGGVTARLIANPIRPAETFVEACDDTVRVVEVLNSVPGVDHLRVVPGDGDLRIVVVWK